jgi:hypothetical protein
MRCGIIFAAALIAMPAAALADSTTTPPAASSAQQQQYCGFLPHLGAMVQCGYSSLEGCENAVGKGAMCFINPYIAMNTPRATPSIISKGPPALGS